jgi:hypothetical protein
VGANAFTNGLDPDGSSGPLDIGDNLITATVTQGGAPKAGVEVAITLVSSSGGTVTLPTPPSGISGSDGKVSFTVRFTDSGSDGGSYTVRVWADLTPNGDLDPGEPFATVTVRYVAVTAVVTISDPVGGNIKNVNVGDDTKDATLTVAVTGPTGATLPVVASIDDAFPASGTTANASFAACDGTDGVDAKAGAAGSTAWGSPFKADIWACNYFDDTTNDTFTVKVFWDVNGNGVADSTEPPITVPPVTITISDT